MEPVPSSPTTCSRLDVLSKEMMPSSSSVWKVQRQTQACQPDSIAPEVMSMFLWSSDISALLGSQSLSRAAVNVNEGLMNAAAQGPPQETATHAVVATTVTGCAVAVAVVLLLIIRRRRRRQQESDRAVIIQDIPGFIEVSYNLYCIQNIWISFMCNSDSLLHGLQEYPVNELRSAASS